MIGPFVHHRIEERARVAPLAAAVVAEGRQLSYRELVDGARELAAELRARGASPDDVVAVLVGRGPSLALALLGIMQSGAAALPVDPGQPPARVQRLLRLAGSRLLVTGGGAAALRIERLDAGAAHRDPVVGDLHPEHLAYVMFTSGSTGAPKPVAVPHRALDALVTAAVQRYRLEPGDRVLQFSSPGFDVLFEELWPALATGAAVVAVREPVPPPMELEQFIRTHGISVANLPSPYWSEWVRDLAAAPRPLPASLRLLVAGSDTAFTATLRAWWDNVAVPVVNAYGVTEAGVTSTGRWFAPRDLPSTDVLPVGRPMLGVGVHVLDEEMAPVPAGRTGGVYLAGPGLARGYHGRPAATAASFLPGPAGGRLYRTGDRARRLPDGDLLLLGRTDDQVKVRGHRVEPAEVAAVLVTHSGVRSAHVQSQVDEATGQRRLVAYVAMDGEPSAMADRLREHARRLLPEPMVPAEFVVRASLPLTSSGKVDRLALASPVPSGEVHVAAPVTELERQLLAIWEEVLPGRRFGVLDRFFDVGGDSLGLVQVHRRLAARFGRVVPGTALFEHPTVRSLAAFLDGGPTSPAPPAGPTRTDELDDRARGLARLRQRRQSAGRGPGRP